MARIIWVGVLLALCVMLLPTPAWALRCGAHIIAQGEAVTDVRAQCGAPFFVDHYVGNPGVGVTVPIEPGAAVTTEAWFYNFGPQRLMVRLDFSGGVLAREQTLGYGFVGQGGTCDYNEVTTGMSVAELIGHCGMPASRGRNTLASAAGLGDRAPAWGETWSYSAAGSGMGFEVQLQRGWVTDVHIKH